LVRYFLPWNAERKSRLGRTCLDCGAIKEGRELNETEVAGGSRAMGQRADRKEDPAEWAVLSGE
jgi:hypothetical protein